MKFKMKLGSPLFLLTLFVVLACSLGSVSAANDIHDVTIEDTSTIIEHPEANIHDSNIQNTLIKTDYTTIYEAVAGGTIQGSMLNNVVTHSTNPSNVNIGQGLYSGSIQSSMVNNVITDVTNEPGWSSGVVQGINPFGTVQNSILNNVVMHVNGAFGITQGNWGNIKNSMINNAVTDIDGRLGIYQGNTHIDDSIQDSMLNNAVISSSGNLYIHQGSDVQEISNIRGSCLNNLVYGSEGKYTNTQNNISNSLISNATLFSENTTITQTNLTGVNGCLIAVGCTNYTKTIDNLTDTNFFNLVIGNHVIFDLKW